MTAEEALAATNQYRYIGCIQDYLNRIAVLTSESESSFIRIDSILSKNQVDAFERLKYKVHFHSDNKKNDFVLAVSWDSK